MQILILTFIYLLLNEKSSFFKNSIYFIFQLFLDFFLYKRIIFFSKKLFFTINLIIFFLNKKINKLEKKK